MARFLIDVNLPYRFSLWHGLEYQHVRDLNEGWTDDDIWAYALEHRMAIVSKDADFSDRVMFSTEPASVVHVRVGNLRIRELHEVLHRHWPWVLAHVERCRLIRLYADRVEAISRPHAGSDTP